ncbi:MAG: hypothetical protein MUC46_08435 [Desulfobacterales bacterium]|nr:hypothetical protein [Desulfobacterales bacterium]
MRWLDAASTPSSLILAGTEPAGVFVSYDAGSSWVIDPGVVKIRDANGWFLPYSPRAGCVRGFAVAGSGPDKGRIYAAVEVGGVTAGRGAWLPAATAVRRWTVGWER